MKKTLCLLLIVCISLSLSGCGGITANYREVEQLLVVQTMGIDRRGTELRVSLASGPDSKYGDAPVRLAASGSSVSTALERLRRLSGEEDLFCAHIRQVVIGEATARRGLDACLDYICRTPDTRIDLPLYVVRGADAETVVTGVGDEKKSIAQILRLAEETMEQRGDGRIYSAARVLRDLERYGSSLICTLELVPSAETGEEAPLTAAPAGFAVIRNGRLCDFIERDDAIAVSLLENDMGIFDLTVRDKFGSPVTLELDSGKCEITPLWSDSGKLTALEIHARVSGSVAETDGSRDGEYADYLTAALENAVYAAISRVLTISAENRADFLGLAALAERSDPAGFRALVPEFAECLRSVDFRISVSGELRHSGDIKDL